MGSSPSTATGVLFFENAAVMKLAAHARLKILWGVSSVRVRPPPAVLKELFVVAETGKRGSLVQYDWLGINTLISCS